MIRHTFYVEDFPDLNADTPMTIVIPRNAGRRFAVEIELPLDALSQTALSRTSPRAVLAFSPSPIQRSPLSPPSLAEVGQAYSPGPLSAMQSVSQSSSLSLSPGEDRFSPQQLTPQSSRTALGADGRIETSRLVSSRSPLYSPPAYASQPASPTFFTTPLSTPRQPTLAEAMKQASPKLPSPGLSPLARVSPGYFGDSSMTATNPANFSPYGLSAGSSGDLSPRSLSRLMTSPQIMSPQGPSFMGNTINERPDFSPAQSSPSYASQPSSPGLSPYVGGQTNRPTPEQMDNMRQYGSYN